MSQDCLRTGDKALVRFRFIKHPEYIKPGQRMVFREGRTKAVGNVIKLIPYSNTTVIQTCRTNKPNKISQNRQNSSSAIQVCIKKYLLFSYKNKNFTNDIYKFIYQLLDTTETNSSFEGQTSKQENILQKSNKRQNKKGRGRRGGRSHNTINSIIQPLSEQNPPMKL